MTWSANSNIFFSFWSVFRLIFLRIIELFSYFFACLVICGEYQTLWVLSYTVLNVFYISINLLEHFFLMEKKISLWVLCPKLGELSGFLVWLVGTSTIAYIVCFFSLLWVLSSYICWSVLQLSSCRYLQIFRDCSLLAFLLSYSVLRVLAALIYLISQIHFFSSEFVPGSASIFLSRAGVSGSWVVIGANVISFSFLRVHIMLFLVFEK